MISLSGVTKRYGAATAVQDLSFTVNSGETLGLLGQNGAGKTTTLNIITGYLAPTSGDVRVGDYDLLTQARQAKRLIGYLPEQPPLYDEMTMESYLRFVCRLRLVVEADIARHVRDIAAQTNLSDVLGRRVGNLSKGYRQRVGLAQALCGEPEVLVLDEPTVGLDPRQTAEFRDTLKKLSGGRTVIFSSHILSEVQALCDRVIILHHGRVACDQRLGDMSRGAGARLQAAIFGDMETLLPALRSLNSVARVTRLPAREAGVAICLLSNNWHKVVYDFADEVGLPIVAKAMKPCPPAYFAAMRKIGAKRKNTVAIGDQLMTDVLGAHTVGIKAYLIQPLVEQDLPHTLFLRHFERVLMGDAQPEAPVACERGEEVRI